MFALRVDTSKPLLTQKQQYKNFSDQVRPGPPILRNAVWSFLAGGTIALTGQTILTFFQGMGLPVLEAGSLTLVVLVATGALLTAIGIYDEITRWAGAGMIVPITGLANAMVAPAMEARREGLVIGIGSHVFSIAGPILVFGVVIAWLAGLTYYFFR